MTKIEIEKPVLPKWLDEYIKDCNFLGEDALRTILDIHTDILCDSNLGKGEDNYVFDNVDKILTAIIYGYEVEE